MSDFLTPAGKARMRRDAAEARKEIADLRAERPHFDGKRISAEEWIGEYIADRARDLTSDVREIQACQALHAAFRAALKAGSAT